MKSNIDEVISMAWSDKISIKKSKKNRSHRKRGYLYNKKNFKKKVI